MKEDFLKDQLENSAVIISPQEGELYEMNGISINLKITSEMTGDQLGIYEIALAPKAIGAKLHYHRFMDETFIVNQGILHIQAGNEEYYAQAGTMVYVPRFTPHAFRNDSDQEVKLTLLFNPAQKRKVFLEVYIKF